MGTWLDDDFKACDRCGWPLDEPGVPEIARDGSVKLLHARCVARSITRRYRVLTETEHRRSA